MYLKLSAPIYYRDYKPRAKKDSVLGLNWLLQASNPYRTSGQKTSTVAGELKKTIYELVDGMRHELISKYGDFSNPEKGYHVHYDVYLGRAGTDGHNVRSTMEKFLLDALENSQLISNDKFVYTTSTRTFIDRHDPRIVLYVYHIEDDYKLEVESGVDLDPPALCKMI